jgi:hypothetical protein
MDEPLKDGPEGLGVPAAPSGLRPFGAEPAAQSQAEPLVPNAGAWIVFLRGRTTYRTALVEKVTAKQVALVRTFGNWERRIDRGDVVAVFADKEFAERLHQSLDGAQGEYQRRVSSARVEFERREGEAMKAFKQVAARLIRDASGMSAFGQDPKGLEAKPASPAPKGDAQGPSA